MVAANQIMHNGDSNRPANFKSGFVTVVGRTNVGKSTLLNYILGRKVLIMSDKPQTTRNKIHAVLTETDYQLVFIDTPGVHKPRHKLGQQMNKTVLSALQEVDVVLVMVEAARPGPGDQYVIEQIKKVNSPVFLVINKIDLVTPDELLAVIAAFNELHNFAEIIPLSALTGENVSRLLPLIVQRMPQGPQYYPDDMFTDRPEQFIIAELIREQVLHLTSQEVPHSVAVVVESALNRPGNMVAVQATIYTERDSQKGILIGKGGQMMKQIGIKARQEMEALLGSRIYLDLRVKVKKDWRNQEGQIHRLGLVED